MFDIRNILIFLTFLFLFLFIFQKQIKKINGSSKVEEELNKEKIQEILENIEDFAKNENSFHIPLSSLFSIIAEVKVTSNSKKINNNNIIEILQNFVQNTIKAHPDEKETLMLLHYIDATNACFTFEKIFSILENFTNCSIINKLCELCNLPEKDYEFIIKQKDQEIQKLKQKMKESEALQLSPSNNDFQPSPQNIVYQQISEKPKDFESDIFIACKEGKCESVQWLIEKENVDKNKKVEKNDLNKKFHVNDTPIHIAAANSHLQIVKYLVEKQYVDVNIKGYEDKTPLHYACQSDHLQIVEYLISKSANVNAKDFSGDYAIHYAARYGSVLTVQYLIEKRNVFQDIQGYEGRTPLHYACLNDHLDIVKYLISHGAIIDAVNMNKWTPLHFASSYNKKDIVKYLVSKGANKSVKNNNGQTPFDLAWGDEIIHILQ